MPIGQCPLCRETRTIVDSHLIPKGVYKYCRPPGGHAIAVSPEYFGQTDRQVHGYLLCSGCEQILSSGGEAWLLPLLAEYKGPFPFYDILTRFEPELVDGDTAGYAAARNPDILCDKLTHFAMGIFFKAAVHSWRGRKTEPMINLGPYREAVRAFLRSEKDFPAHMALTIGVMPVPVKLATLEYPVRGNENRWHYFSFYVPGIRFVLAVGKSLSAGLRHACFVRHPAHPIIVKDFSSGMMLAILETINSSGKMKQFEKLAKDIK